MKTAKRVLKVIMIVAILLVPLCASAETPEETYTQIHNLRKVDGEFQQAADIALAFLTEHPDKDIHRQKIHYEYAAALFQQEKFADAKTAFLGLTTEYADTVLDKSAEDFFVDDAQYFAAMLEQTQGEKDIDKAITAYKAVVDNFPQSNRRVQALVTLGDLNREKEKWVDSIEYYYQVVEGYPETELACNALFYANRALIHSDEEADDPKTEEVEDNSKEIEKNIARMLKDYGDKANTTQATFDLINYYNTKAKFDKAESYCEVMFEKYPADERTLRVILEWVDLVTRVDGKKRYEEAVEWVELVRKGAIERQDSELYENSLFYKGLALRRKGDRDGAINHFESILQECPETTLGFEIKFLIGSCYIEKKEYDTAIEKLEALLEEKPDEDWPAAITYTIGYCYQLLHDAEKTKEHYDRVVAEYPDTSWAKSVIKKRADIEEMKKSQ